jgi:nitrite reductase/ring-hydroxylating ferredoxin subunit
MVVSGRWIDAGAADGLAPGSMTAVRADPALTVAVARLENGDLAAFSDDCTHEECPLSDGWLEGRSVVCYCHNAAFDLETGTVMRGPAEDPLRIFTVRVEDGRILVDTRI